MMDRSAILPTYIDSTMMSCFRSCPQKFLLEFCHGFRPENKSIDLHAGGCFATAIETASRAIHTHGKSLPDAIDIAHAAFAVAWGDFEIPEYKKTAKTFDRTWEAVVSYFEQYPPHTDHVQPYFHNNVPTFEFTFSIPLEPFSYALDDGHCFPAHTSGAPFMYSGRFDMLGEYSTRPCVRDEKTTGGSISTGWADKWDLRSQFIGYTWACQQLGIDLDTVIVRGIAIQKTQIVHAEVIKTYTDFIRERWYEQLRRDLWRIRRAWDEKYFDFNLAETCTAYGGCMFTDVCASPNMESWTSDFVIQRWNPLHKNPVEESTP